MSAARDHSDPLAGLTVGELRAIIREENERLEARMRGQRPKGKRRLRAPEAAAAAARSVASPGPMAKASAERALRRIRERG